MSRLWLSLFLIAAFLVTGCNSNLGIARRHEAKSDEHVEYGEYAEALVEINKAIELVDDVSSFYEKRGFIRDSEGEYSKAATDYKKAMELDPDNFWAKNNYVSVLSLSPNESDRDGDTAVKLGSELVETAIEINDRMMKTYALDTYGSALAEVGRFEEAVESCQKALKSATADERQLIQTNIATYRQGRCTRYQPDGSYEVVPEPAEPEQLEP